MHNKVWGSAEILANSVETIVFVNTLHLLPEGFLAFFLGLLLPPIQCALHFKKFWNESSPSFVDKIFKATRFYRLASCVGFTM